MKSLTELIEAVQDVESPYGPSFTPIFKAGARSQARLAEALKSVLHDLDDSDWVHPGFAKRAKERVRKLLETGCRPGEKESADE